ncbi:hypothetical protein YC2023_041388 [Brassica napus]
MDRNGGTISGEFQWKPAFGSDVRSVREKYFEFLQTPGKKPAFGSTLGDALGFR